MKKQKVQLKKQIKRRIDLPTKMNDKDKIRMGTKSSPSFTPISVGLISRKEIRNNKRTLLPPKHYDKKIFVDYDVVICIPSHERYEKIKRLISQFHEQPTKYTYKIILLNDGSKSHSYDKLIEEFPEIIYIKNDEPNGKLKHWYCYSQMWEHLKNIECHAVLQMDDDFILCDNFLDTILDIYFERKEIDDHMRGISPHTWSFKKGKVKHENWWNQIDFVDGISLLDVSVIENMNYVMHAITSRDVTQTGVPVGTWDQINATVNKMRGYYYRTPESLVYHDGNNDSKLHGDHRINGKGVFTKKLTESLKKYHD